MDGPQLGERYWANQIGIVAKEHLSKNFFGEVAGLTSKGVFLKLADSSIVFLSDGPFANPLTVNLSRSVNNLPLQIGESFQIRGESLQFQKFMIETQQASIWSSRHFEQPFPNLLQVSSTIQFLERLRFILDKPVALLDEVLAILESRHHSLMSDPETHLALLYLSQNALTSPLQCAKAIQFFAGRGRGLTPSGDDLLSGWIYMLIRWAISENYPLEPLQQVLLRNIENRTTAISINLIKAACQGEIDERLLNAFEMMIGIRSVQDDWVRNILEWGSSSGVEVCAGFGLGVLTIKHL